MYILNKPAPLCDHFVAFSALFHHQIHTFEQGQKFRMTQGTLGRAIPSKAGELTLLESLAPNTVTALFKRQQLDLGATPVDKNKPMATGRILPQVVSHHRRQTIKGTPHVGWRQAQPDPPARRDTQHGRRRRKTTSAPSCSSTSQDSVAACCMGSDCNSTNTGSFCKRFRGVDPSFFNFVRQRLKLLRDTPCSRQNWSLVCPLCSKREKRSRH